MADTMSIADYLARGGVLSNPENVPPRYRAELMRLMATFVDSEMAGSAGFADIINEAPGIAERIAAARIVLEKADHAGRVLAVMAEFGADTAKYATHQPWTARLARDADIGPTRSGGDMRLSVFHYPLEGWLDAVVMNVLMGRAVTVQLAEFSRVSYQPLAEAFRAILPVETRHAELGEEGLRKLLEDGALEAAQASVDYWWPRVAASFGAADSTRLDQQRDFGLRHRSNAELLADWRADTAALLAEMGLRAPG
ncbi:phenylacetic acid catabolic [Maritimibacter sp. 55A14]|uniref:Phenylacetic acid catabolic protein n=1 Tax=Maritimibacter sp. 55A14 TaxID=2174844 RepID=UPI000D6220E7|nr:Phenylacetic acid catabolic protein [Maritimibacter sp. 55A14]PWE32831.1 phenylacetic acid catabolic [Maritimibacter sp. 55A14]